MQSDGDAGQGRGLPVADLILACAIAVLSIAVIISAFQMPRPEGWSDAPGLFPLICGIGLLIMAAILALSAAQRPAVEGEAPADTAEADEPEWARTLLVGGSVVVYALVLIPLMGYTAATFTYLVVVVWYFWRGNPLWILVISLGTTVFLSQTFERMFSIVLP
jgi:hypothetical protein